MPDPTPIKSSVYPRFESLDATAKATEDVAVVKLGDVKVLLVPPRLWQTYLDGPLAKQLPDGTTEPLAYIQPQAANSVKLSHFRIADPFTGPGSPPPPPPAGEENEEVLWDYHFDWKRNWEFINKKEYKLYATFKKVLDRRLIVRMNGPVGIQTDYEAPGTYRNITTVPAGATLHRTSIGVTSGEYFYDVPSDALLNRLAFSITGVQAVIDAYVAANPAPGLIDDNRALKILGVIVPNLRSFADKDLVNENQPDPPVIFYGVDPVPSPSLGKAGDYYVDTSLGVPFRNFGPKTSSWPNDPIVGDIPESVFIEARKHKNRKEQIASALRYTYLDRLFLFDDPDYFGVWIYPKDSQTPTPPVNTLVWGGPRTANQLYRQEIPTRKDDFRPSPANSTSRPYTPRLSIGRFIRSDIKFPEPGVVERIETIPEFNPFQPADNIIPFDPVPLVSGKYSAIIRHPPLYNGGFNPFDGVSITERLYNFDVGFTTDAEGHTHPNVSYYGNFAYDWDPTDKWFGGAPENPTTAAWIDSIGGSFTADIAYVTFGWTYELTLVEELPAG